MKYHLPITVLIFVTLWLGSIAGTARAQAQADAQLTVEDLENAQYRSQSTLTRTVQLVDGVYEDTESGLRIALTEHYAFGDLNGDGVDDAAAILATATTEETAFYELVALIRQTDPISPTDTVSPTAQTEIGGLALLGEGITIDELAIANGKITVNYLRSLPGAPADSPARPVTQSFFSRRGLLVPEQTKSFGQLFPYPVGNLYGYVNVLGEMVIEPQFTLAGDFSEGMAPVSYDGRSTGFINQSGELVIAPRFSYAGNFAQGLAMAGLPGVDADVPFLTVYIDRIGRLVLGDQRFVAAEPFSEGLAAVSYDGEQYGYINLRGEIVIEPQFTQAEPFSEGLAPVQSAGQYGFIDRSGEFIIPPQFEAAEPFQNGLAQVVISGTTGYLNQRGAVVIEPTWDYGSDFSEGRALVARDNQFFYIDETGAVVIELPEMTGGSDFAEGLAAVAVGDLYGYIDRQGNTVVPPQFSAAGSFKNGLAVVKTPGTWGLINSIGEVVLEIQPPAAEMQAFAAPAAMVAAAEPGTELLPYAPAVPETIRTGACTANSEVIPLASAWQCTTEDRTYDPCLTAIDGKTIVCDAVPALGQVGFQVDLSEPLPAPQVAKQAEVPIWLVQLADGATCTAVTALELLVEDQRVNYTCSDNTMLLGEFDQSQTPWQANKVTLINTEGVYSVESAVNIAVVKAWQPSEPQ